MGNKDGNSEDKRRNAEAEIGRSITKLLWRRPRGPWKKVQRHRDLGFRRLHYEVSISHFIIGEHTE